ncbi:MAG: prepilin-type N-terminal cleavage/methylation domain-containing protein [Bacillota bacterium]
MFRKARGFTLTEVVVAVAILGLAAAALLNLFILGARLTSRAEHLLQAVNLAQARLEELKNTPYAEIAGQEKTPCVENTAYSYRVDVAGSTLGFGLKTLTVTIYYQELGKEKSLSVSMEKGER